MISVSNKPNHATMPPAATTESEPASDDGYDKPRWVGIQGLDPMVSCAPAPNARSGAAQSPLSDDALIDKGALMPLSERA